MLSICIPTFERHRFLRWTLDRLVRDFPSAESAELIVSDNCSQDGSAAWLEDWCIGRATVLLQHKNIGAFPNMYAALTAAKGRYAVYCADDDYLKPKEINRAIAFLEANPGIAAYCAPCEIWDEIEGKPFWNAFAVKESRSFDKSQGMELFNFIIQSHVWPEHIIYRTPVPIKPRTRAYWAFADLVEILETGSIYFDSVPFYRNILVHPVGDRVQLGNEQCLTHFDEYRAGLEVLAHGLFGSELPYRARNQINEMISHFICLRLNNAAQLYARQGHVAEATMLLQRVSIATPRRDHV